MNFNIFLLKTLALSALVLAVNATNQKAFADDFTVTVRGSFFGFNGSTNSIFPLKGARVVLMDSDADGSTIFDDEMGISYIKDDGSFEVTGKGGDPWPWSKPDVYIRIYYNNDKGVRLTNELDWDRYYDMPQHDHDNIEGDLDIGSWVIGQDVGAGNASKCGVWMAACNEWNKYLGIMSAPPPSGKFDVEYWSGIWSGTPWTNDNTAHWPIHYSTSAMGHEFGHLIRHSADGSRDHFNWDVTRFRYARNHSRCDINCNRMAGEKHSIGFAFGFNEGWAEFWTGDTWSCGSNIDDECEGNNAFALGNLSRMPGIGRKRMVEILIANPGKIHSLDEFVNSFVSATQFSIVVVKDSMKSIRTDKSIPHPAYVQSVSQRLTVAKKQIQEAKNQLTALERSIRLATESATRERECDSPDCYKKFTSLLQPIVLKAEYAIKKLELERIEQAATEKYRENYIRSIAAKNADSISINQKKSHEKKVYRINMDAYKQALEVFKRVKSKDKTGELYREEIEMKLAKFKKISSNGILPLSAQTQFSFQEDIAQKRQN